MLRFLKLFMLTLSLRGGCVCCMFSSAPPCRALDPRSPHTTLRCSPGPVHSRSPEPPTTSSSNPQPTFSAPLLDQRGAGRQTLCACVCFTTSHTVKRPDSQLSITWPGTDPLGQLPLLEDRSFHKVCES